MPEDQFKTRLKIAKSRAKAKYSTKNTKSNSSMGTAFKMSTELVAAVAVGVVAAGAIRDVPGIQRSGISVWAEGRVPGHGPFNAVSLGEQVNVSGLNINEEDVLVADADGITKIENEILNDIIKVCEEVRKDEARTQKFFSVKDKTRYKSWTTQGYT